MVYDRVCNSSEMSRRLDDRRSLEEHVFCSELYFGGARHPRADAGQALARKEQRDMHTAVVVDGGA